MGASKSAGVAVLQMLQPSGVNKAWHNFTDLIGSQCRVHSDLQTA